MNISSQMITLIKLLVILFISLLGYDTINLFIQHHNTNEEPELGKCGLDNEARLENITWDFWAICLVFLATAIYLYKKWQKSRRLITDPKTLINLQFTPEIKEISIDRELNGLSYNSRNKRLKDYGKRETLDNSRNERLKDYGKRETLDNSKNERLKDTNNKETLDYCKNERLKDYSKKETLNNSKNENKNEAPKVYLQTVYEDEIVESKMSITDKSLGITDMLIEKMLSEPPPAILDELLKANAIPEENEDDFIDIYEELSKKKKVPSSKFRTPTIEATNQQQIAVESDPRGRLIINYAQLEPKSHSERMPFSFILPETRTSTVGPKPCECNVSKLEERLELVENGLKSTERITVLWRNRIEQTEEELLELQQQIHCILLDWSIKKCSVNFLNSGDNNIEPNISANNNSNILATSYSGSYKPLQIINEIIEESRKEEEKNEKADAEESDIEEVIVAPKSFNFSATQTNNSDSTEASITVISKPIPSIHSLKRADVKEKAISENTMKTAVERSYIDQYTEMSTNTVSDSSLINRKRQGVINVRNKTPPKPQENGKYETELELSFSISESYAEPNDHIKEKVELLQRNEELKNETETLVKEIETVLNDESLRGSRKFNHVQPKVPSHVVTPRTGNSRKQTPRRPPRCAYSVTNK